MFVQWLGVVAAFLSLVVVFLAAVGSLMAGLGAAWAAHETGKAAKANVTMNLFQVYFSKELGEDMAFLRRFEQDNKGGAEEAYVNALADEDGRYLTQLKGSSLKLFNARRNVDNYYFMLKVYCEAGLVEKKFIAKTLGRAHFDFFLDVHEPIKKAHSKLIRSGYDGSMGRFFMEMKSYC